MPQLIRRYGTSVSLSTEALRPTGLLSAYGASKLGLWSATQAMAKELAEHKILVNAVTPGATITEERIVKMKEVAFGEAEVPQGAVKNREKMETMMKSGNVVQMDKELPANAGSGRVMIARPGPSAFDKPVN
jgi:NAD(P)-dependent dehydrogenase (short-subunit alcohol dehydrogenase family)